MTLGTSFSREAYSAAKGRRVVLENPWVEPQFSWNGSTGWGVLTLNAGYLADSKYTLESPRTPQREMQTYRDSGLNLNTVDRETM